MVLVRLILLKYTLNEEILNDENQINHIINNPSRYGESFVFSENRK